MDPEKVQKTIRKVTIFFFTASTILLSFLISFFSTLMLSGLFTSDKKVHNKIISFFLGNNEAIINFSKEEIIHMHDVRGIILVLFIILIIIIIQTTMSLYMITKKLKKGKSILFKTSKILRKSNLVLFISLIITIMFFKPLFIIMHKIVFNNYYWILPSNSFLIKAYPEFFFILMTIILFVSTIIIMEIFKVSYKYLSLKDKLKKLQKKWDK